MHDPAPATPENAVPDAGLARWHLRLLGAVELVDARGHMSRLPSRAATLLLAQLALAPQRQHAREELADRLWPGAAAAVGRNRLRQTLSVLRTLLDPPGQALHPAVQADRRAVWLTRGVLVCDGHTFGRALDAQDVALAARCYQGELLPGYFDEWVLEERRHLAARADTLTQQMAAATPPSASVAAVLPEPLSAAAPAPFTAAFTAASTAASLAAFAPATDTSPSPDARLPLYLTRLVGFEASSAALLRAISQSRLVVLRGPGGGGKTRLAVEVARTLAQRSGGPPAAAGSTRSEMPFELLVFVPLVACTTRAQMLDAVLLSLRQHGVADTADAAERVARTLAGRRVLLVLDNFEQLVEVGRGDLARWLSQLPQLHLLVTSRRVLGLDGEVDQPLPALPLPAPGADLQAHALNPAVLLFVDRARAARADFHLSERNHTLVARTVHALHGLPLAIELAAARVRSLGLAEMHQMLEAPATAGQALALLVRSSPRSADDPRHASMLRVLQWSWQQLQAPEQALLAALAVCEGGATLQLLHRLCLALPHASHATQPAPAAVKLADVALWVDALVSASVVYVSGDADTDADTDAPMRYHAFEPMREFVFLQAGAEGPVHLRAAHACAMAQWAQALGTEPALAEVRADWRNLVRALASGADPQLPPGSAERAIDTALAARWALDDIILSPGAIDSLRAAAKAAPTHRSALVQALLATHSFDAGQRGPALAHAHAALSAAAQGPADRAERAARADRADGVDGFDGVDGADGAERAEVLTHAARVMLRVGHDIARVQALLDEAILLARQHGTPDIEARAMVIRSVVLYRREHDAVGNAALQAAALALWLRHGPRARATSGLVNYAIGLGFLRRVQEQLPLLEAARAQAAQHGQLGLLAFAHSVTGYVLADLRRYPESAASYRLCLQLAWAHSDWREWFYALLNLPRTLAHQRRPQAAARLLGFAQTFYAQRFGELGREDLPEVRRTRRLVAVQLGPDGHAHGHALWLEGAALSMAEAMRLALAETADA